MSQNLNDDTTSDLSLTQLMEINLLANNKLRLAWPKLPPLPDHCHSWESYARSLSHQVHFYMDHFETSMLSKRDKGLLQEKRHLVKTVDCLNASLEQAHSENEELKIELQTFGD